MNASAPEPGTGLVVADILADVEATIRRYVLLPGDHEAAALALFVAHTYALDGAHATPYLLVVSPEKRSGKSRLLEVLELLVAQPWRVSGVSEAAMFRKLAKDRPTLLLDELDAVFGKTTERTEPLRSLLNAGNRPDAKVARCVGEGGKMTVQDFDVFSAKVLAWIDTGYRIPDTVRDRSITVSMVRKTEGEPVARFRTRDAEAETEPLREVLAEWAVGATDWLHEARPDEPAALDDRAAEAWEPLFAIADLAGGEWPERAREAAKTLSGSTDADEQAIGTLLLGAIRLELSDQDRIQTAALLDRINADDELPFGGWREGKGLDGRSLARLLKPYGIRPRTIRLDGADTPKGYLREQFTEAWERYLPGLGEEAPQAPHSPQDTGDLTLNPHGNGDVAGVADVAAVLGASSDAAPCRWPTHRDVGLDWTNDAGRRICGICHPRASGA